MQAELKKYGLVVQKKLYGFPQLLFLHISSHPLQSCCGQIRFHFPFIWTDLSLAAMLDGMEFWDSSMSIQFKRRGEADFVDIQICDEVI